MTVDPRLAHLVRRTGALKPYLIAVAAVFGAYVLFGWLALPGIVQSQAEKYIRERSGHRLTMDRPSFNPLLLDVRIKNLRLAAPDGSPLLSFKELLIDFSPISILRRAYVFNEIRLEEPIASVDVLPQGRLNWSPLIAVFKGADEVSPEEEKSGPLPRLLIRKFALSDGRLDLADRRTTAERSTSLVPLDIELADLSTLPNQEGRYELTAKTSFGADIHWDGQVTLNPMSVAGTFRAGELSLAKLAAFAPLPPAIANPEGSATLTTRYRAGMIADAFDVQLHDLSIAIDRFHVQGKTDPNASLELNRIDVEGGEFDLLERRIAIRAIAASGGGIRAERTIDGRINVLDLIPPENKNAPAESAGAEAAQGWHYRIERMTLNGFESEFRDRTADPAADLAIQRVTAEVGGVSDDTTTPVPVRLTFQARDGGTFSAEGNIVPAAPSADLQIKIDRLALAPVQPYLGTATTLTLVDGALSSAGRGTYDDSGAQYAGSLKLENIRIVETDGQKPFLAWKALTTDTLAAGPAHIDIGDLTLDGLDTRLIIGEDKSINFAKVLRPGRSAQASPDPATSSSFEARIRRLQIQGGELDFADQSLALPFRTRIHGLTGALINVSSKPDAAADIKLVGQVDDHGAARAEGRLNLFKPADFLHIDVAFRNVEMTRLTPYAATFVGRRIDSGKLSLNLQYRIDNGHLSGDNQIIMDQLTLGDRVESPQARDLPLDLAIAILEDSDGRIDLGLPVSGSLNNPQFSFGDVLGEALINAVTGVVTSPFRALGALFGGDDQFDGFVFEAGQSTLAPPEREKLERFADALKRRPNLAVTVHGTWSDADRLALQDLALRKALAAKLGLSADGDPGPITADDPDVKPALEDLYRGRFGSGALAALKEGYRKANPGQLPETTGGQVMSVLTGLIGTKPTLSDRDIDALKGTDFHEVLYRKLRDAQEMPETKLQELARARGQDILSELGDAQAPLDRVTLRDVEKVDSDEDGVPLKIDMGTARTTGGALPP